VVVPDHEGRHPRQERREERLAPVLAVALPVAEDRPLRLQGLVGVDLIADEERVLVITVRGELILLDAKADECTIISRLRIFDEDEDVYSHPALVGTRLYARGGSSVVCVDLEMN